jgi:molybdopterin converting factor small subunit
LRDPAKVDIRVDVDSLRQIKAAIMNQLEIRLFAGARDAVGLDRIDLEILLPVSSCELKTAIGQKYPQLQSLLSCSRIAMGHVLIDDQQRIEAADLPKELAIIPPVSGG